MQSAGFTADKIVSGIYFGLLFLLLPMPDTPSNPPAITVCMSTYNAAEYLRESVVSILGQTFGDFEFIIIDDGSTDSTPRLLAKLTRGDSRVRVIRRPNTGISIALNEAVAMARGEFLARMDADDIALPERFAKQVAYLREHPDCVVVGSHVMMIDPYGSPLYEPKHELDHDAIVAGFLAGAGWSIVHPVSMMRRQPVVEVGGYRPDLEPSEDIDLFLRLSERGRLANLPDVLLQYRQHTKSANHTRVAEQNHNKRRIITEAYARRSMALPDGWVPPQRNIMPIRDEIDMWGWLALRKHNVSAARRHAVSLLRLAPMSKASWRLLFCALRGR